MAARTSVLIACVSACVCAALTACTTEAAPPDDDELSCQRTLTAENSAPGPAIDLVLVVSDAPAMAPYRDALIDNLAAIGGAAATAGHGPLLHVAVVGAEAGRFTATPQRPGCAPPDDDHVIDLRQPWFECPGEDGCSARNYDGALADVVPCIAALPADGAAGTPLLARLEQALDPSNPATASFVRPHAWLVVIVITAEDDASPGDAAGYAERLRATRDDPDQVLLATVGPASAPRLDAFRAVFGNRAAAADITAATWPEAIDVVGATGVSDLLLAGCIRAGELLDLDEAAAGLQADCTATEHDPQTGELGAAIPPCLMATADRPDPATPLPCFRIRAPDASERGLGCDHMAVIERALWPHARGAMQCACDPLTPDE